jgi:hypothetical protein
MKMKRLMYFALALVISGLWLAGCASVDKNDQAPTNALVVQPQDGTKSDQPLVIRFDVRFDEQARHYVIDVREFETVNLKAGESVVWECVNNVPFTIDMGLESPFQATIFSAKKTDGVYRTDAAVVPRNFAVSNGAKPFKYFIAVYLQELDTVVTCDPRILFIPPDYDY